jgi:2-polyprenyl-6-methoxyphenol hydroxylase-like FAD-dependent oxidoreductase
LSAPEADQHERLLIERLEALGVSVERRTELVSFTDGGESVIARLHGPEGQEESCEASYIAGCDGARSIVRETQRGTLISTNCSRPAAC